MTVLPSWRSRGALIAVWAGVAVGCGALLGLARLSGHPLDDPDPARQRPGVLDVGGLPRTAPEVTGGLPATGRRTVLFFERPERLERLCTALDGHALAGEAALAVIVSGPGNGCGSRVAVVVDPTGDVPRRYGMPGPRDGGAPVGYAVVDSMGRTRYRTLDPVVADDLDEVATMVASTP